MKNELCSKDYAEFVNIAKYKDRNPNKRDREKFTKEEIDRLWEVSEDVNLNEQYFDARKSKTESVIRRVPIADKVLPFFTNWYNDGESDYLLHTETGNKFDYHN